MAKRAKQPMTTLERIEDNPQFTNEAEEDEFWPSRELGETILSGMVPVPPSVLPVARGKEAEL